MSDDRPRLPLPGEQPTTVFQPAQRGRRRRGRRVQWGRLWQILPLLLIPIGLGLGWWVFTITRVPLTVVVDGRPVEVATHRPHVKGALRAAGVRINDTVHIQPDLEAPISRDMTITVVTSRPVLVYLPDGLRLVASQSTDPAQIVAETGYILQPGEAIRVERALQPTAGDIRRDPALADFVPIPREIRIVPLTTVIVSDQQADGTQTAVSFTSAERTLGAALGAAGYEFYEADSIEPGYETALTGGQLAVTIARATPVTLLADGQQRTLRTHAATVEVLLKEHGLAAVGDDYVEPGGDTPVTPGMQVRLIRVTSETVAESIAIPFETTYIADPDLDLDQQREVQRGTPGELERLTRLRREDGRIVSRVPAGERVVRRPEAQVVAYGTNIVIHTLQTPYGEIEYWRKLRVLATSYSPLTAGHKQPGDPFFGLSGTGTPVERGIIATDPRIISLYTRMYVPDYGLGQALDVGGAVKGLRIDLGYDDANLVLWNNWVEIYLMLPIPSPDQIAWVLPD